MFIQLELKGGKRINVDGTRTIRAYISHNGKAYYTTKYAVKQTQWDARRSKIKDEIPNSQLWNNELARIKNDVEGLCLKHPNLSAGEIVKMIGKNSVENLFSYFQSYIDSCEAGKENRAIGTVKKYKIVLKSLKDFPQRTDFDTINQKWYNSYTGHLRESGMNENTIGNFIKFTKMILRRAHETGVSLNMEYQKKYFKKPSQTTDSIYLTEEEIVLFENVNLSNYDYLQEERDRFMLSYYFLLRFGDSLKVNESNVFEDKGKFYLKIISEKTTTESILPIKPKALILLKKYDYKMPTISNSESNWKLKKIGGLAEIATMTSLSGRTEKKFEFITSHTARRSAATNLYLQGLPLLDLSRLLGHKKVSQTEEYIRVSKLESAKKALNLPFFS